MAGEAVEPELPTDACRAGAELLPLLVGFVREVLERQPRGLGRPPIDRDVHPRGVAAVLPRDLVMPRRLALEDLAAGVALDLVAAAEAQLAGDRREPARQALGVGDAVPQILLRRLVGARRYDAAGGPPLFVA